MSDKTHETSKNPELISEICKAEELYCNGKSTECDAAYQALFDRFTKPKEQIQIIQHWNECLIAIYNDLTEKRRYDEALEVCQKSLLLLEKYPVELNHKLLSTQNTYAGCLNHTGNHEQAIKVYKELLVKSVNKYGKSAHNTLITIGNLAGAFQRIGKIPSAIQMRTRAVNGFLQLHGKKDRDYMRELSNLSDDYSLLGNTEKAICLMSQVYELRRKNLGEHNVYTLDSLNMIGLFYRHLLKYSTAAEYYGKARELTLSDDYYTLIAAIRLADCYACIDQNKKALEVLNSISKKVNECEVENNFLRGSREYVYSLMELNNRNYSAAEAHAEEALRLELKEDEQAHTSKRFLAEILFYSGNYDKANKVIEEIHDEYLKESHNANLCLKFECLYANIKSAVGDFQISADALNKAALISRQCHSPAAGFLIASSKAFAAYFRLDMECFEKYKSIALGYSGWGVDRDGFSVRWLKQL